MTNPGNAETMELINIIKNTLSMELRVENSEVDSTVKSMENLGFKYKNSWASMQLPDHTVIDFWRKELIKSSNVNNDESNEESRMFPGIM